MKKFQTIITIVIIFIMIVINFAILYLMIDIKLNLKNDIGTSVNKTIESVDIPKAIKNEVKVDIDNLKIGAMVDESVAKKVGSLNLKNGEKGDKGDSGKDSISINTVTTEKIIEQIPINGIDGGTPVMRCNTTKNRWEATYDGGVSYKIIYNEFNKQVKCSQWSN